LGIEGAAPRAATRCAARKTCSYGSLTGCRPSPRDRRRKRRWYGPCHPEQLVVSSHARMFSRYQPPLTTARSPASVTRLRREFPGVSVLPRRGRPLTFRESRRGPPRSSAGEAWWRCRCPRLVRTVVSIRWSSIAWSPRPSPRPAFLSLRATDDRRTSSENLLALAVQILTPLPTLFSWRGKPALFVRPFLLRVAGDAPGPCTTSTSHLVVRGLRPTRWTRGAGCCVWMHTRRWRCRSRRFVSRHREAGYRKRGGAWNSTRPTIRASRRPTPPSVRRDGPGRHWPPSGAPPTLQGARGRNPRLPATNIPAPNRSASCLNEADALSFFLAERLRLHPVLRAGPRRKKKVVLHPGNGLGRGGGAHLGRLKHRADIATLIGGAVPGRAG